MPLVAERREDSDGVGDQVKAKKRKISLSVCSVCASAEARYTCPGCLRHSCSLLCVKKHKDQWQCSGVRDKTAFVALSKFDQMDLLSDYRFLEDTGRFADSARRDRFNGGPHNTARAKKLMNFARKMNINLRFFPITFTKNTENSTIFLSRERRFLWHVKLLFPMSSASFSERVSDENTLEQILTPYVHPTESDPVRRQKLKLYVHARFDNMKVFMRVEGRKANSLRYDELALDKSLRENLSFKTVFEYPVLHVVLPGHFHDYPLKEAEALSPSRLQNGAELGRAPSGNLPRCWEGLQGVAAGDAASPPVQKRAKREEDEEPEEGELTDSSEDAAEDRRSPVGSLGDVMEAEAEAALAKAVLADAALAEAKLAEAKLTEAKIAEVKIADTTLAECKVADAAIVVAKIGNGAPSEAVLAEAKYTEAKLADAALVEAKLVDAALVEAKLVDAALVEAKLVDATLVEAKLADGPLAKAELAEAKIANAALIEAKLADATVVEAKLANDALAEAALSEAKLAEAKIDDSALAEAKIADSALSEAKIADDALAEASLAEASLAEAKLAEAKIADSALAEAKVADGALAEAKIGDASSI